MSDTDDELMNQLHQLDPTISDSAPQAGSLRFISIKEHVMNTANKQHPDSVYQPQRKLYKQRRFHTLIGAAAAITAVVAVTSLLVPGTTPSAAAEVKAAAENLAEVTDFRFLSTSTNPVFTEGMDSDGQLVIEVDDGKYRMITNDNGETVEAIGIGETEWVVINGEVVYEEPIQGGNAAEEFSINEASVEVIEAALESSEVVNEGTEIVNGVETTRYSIEVDDASRAALSKLPELSLSLFGLASEQVSSEDPEDGEWVEETRQSTLEEVNTLSIWVADGLVHQITVDAEQGQTTSNFYDFNDDITITAPE